MKNEQVGLREKKETLGIRALREKKEIPGFRAPGREGGAGSAGPKGDKGDPGEGLTGEAIAMPKLAGSEEPADIAAKVNAVIDALIARGVCKAEE